VTNLASTGTRSAADAAAHRAAVNESFESIVGFLVDLLGFNLVAHIADVDVSTVRRWVARETRPDNADRERRLRGTHQVARLLLSHDANETVRAWFIGMNPQLDDEAPADVLKQDRLKDALVAARAFTDGA
jgi:hypothetical protein